MTRVIHTGDTHIGYRQYHSPERREDFLRAFRQVVDDAVADDVDAVIHAGDLFHDRRPSLADLQGTIDALRDLKAADVPFLAVVGNHEGKRDGQWLDLFEDLGLATRLGAEPEVVGETAFYGLDYVPRSRRDDLDYEFEGTDAEYRALVAHGLFEPFAHADWDTERVLSAASVDFDAMLLGDNHAPGKQRVEGAWVTYCGSTERASASERDERGYNIVTFGADAAEDGVRIARRGLGDATRDFVFVDVELADGEGVERVRERVRQHDLADAVVIVTIEGDGEPITPAAVEEFALERDALIARVNDRREIDEERETDVSFADPDEAVRRRVRDLGLSDAARDVDETVRERDVADANVRETVERRVRDLLDDDPGAFEPAGEGEGSSSDDGSGRAADGNDPSTDPDDGTGADGGDATTGASDPDEFEAATADPDEHEPVADEAGDDGTASEANDDQASMEEYL